MASAEIPSEDGGAKPDEKPKPPSKCVTISILIFHCALVGVVAYMSLGLGLNPSPHTDGKAETSTCIGVLAKDDLVHLALRTKRDQTRQLLRWDTCDPTIRKRARDTLPKDDVEIAVIGFALFYATARCWRRYRWRIAAYIGGALAALYVASDITENVLLRGVLGPNGTASGFLHWPAAIKFGALLGALPVFLVSLSYAVSEAVAPRSWKLRPAIDWHAIPQFIKRSLKRLRAGREHAAPPEPLPDPYRKGADRTMGVCCSGGGIRSAAFSLGALQALDDRDGGRELARAEWLSAVSGGSYLAAAWVSARKNSPDWPPDELPWARRSLEEDHLRRHSSYLAPGVGGKVWALARYLLGLALNLGAVALVVSVLFLPYGWVIARYEQPQAAGKGSSIVLPAGGCMQLPDGTRLAAVPGTTLQLADTKGLEIDPQLPGPAPAAAAAQPSASASATGSASASASATAGGSGAPAPPPPAPTPTTTCPQSTQSTQSPSAAASASAAPAVPLRRLDQATQVALHLATPLQVRGENVAACPEPQSAAGTWTCSTSDADVFQFAQKVRLVSAPSALMTLRGETLVVRRDGKDLPQGGVDAADGAYATLVTPCGSHPCESSAAPEFFTWLTLGLLGVALLAGIALIVVRPRRSSVPVLTRSLTYLGIAGAVSAAVVFGLPYLIVAAENGRWWLDNRFRFGASGAGIGTIALALVSQIGAFTGSSDKAPSGVQKALKSVGTKLRPVLVKFAGAAVGPLLVLLAAVLIGSYGTEHAFGSGQLELWLIVFGFLACLLAGGDLNEWSLHPFYRDQLREGFVRGPANELKDESTEYLQNALPTRNPKLLICAAANIADDRATPPGRPVASWVFCRDEMGSDALRRVLDTSGFIAPKDVPEGLASLTSLWDAVAVSGAAFSPSMGKMTKPERFLFALGNLRLGVWYPNPAYLNSPNSPGHPGRHWYERHHPRPWYLLKEALGLHRATDPWIYVTDGGHYENLGLVELLRRGCRQIYCFDGSGDTTSTFGTIAEAMRLAREEIDVDIELDPDAMKASKDGISAFGTWAGTIRYHGEAQPSGWIVVAKLEVPKGAPFDIVDLARTLPAFPSNPTSDQLYTDQKFEAYRALGHYLGMQAKKLGTDIRGGIQNDDVGSAVESALRTLRPAAPPADSSVAVTLTTTDGG